MADVSKRKKINQAVTVNLKTNDALNSGLSVDSETIQINNMNELFGELKTSVLKAKKNGYSNEQIYIYLQIMSGAYFSMRDCHKKKRGLYIYTLNLEKVVRLRQSLAARSLSA